MSATIHTTTPSTLHRLKQMDKGFWTLFVSSCLIDFGLCLYFFMFSLFLVEHKVSVQNIGFITAAQTVGTIAGIVLVTFLVRRFGLRAMMFSYVIAAPVCLGSRVFFMQMTAQVALAVVAGIAMSIWSVCFSPTLAKLTTQENRTFGFSLFVAVGIASGALGGMVGGYVPGFLHSRNPHGDGIKVVLLIACSILLLAAFSIMRLRLKQDAAVHDRSGVISTFLLRFLFVAAVWSFALSFFTPFANVYLSRHLGLPLMRIGEIYTISQLITVATVLLAPLLYRRTGLVPGIAIMQVATACCLWALSRAAGGNGAIAVYFALVAVQWVAGPGLSSLLMSRTQEGHRSQASAMHNMLNLGAQAGAAALAGKLFGRYGYSLPLVIDALLAALAGVLLYILLRGDSSGKGAAEESAPPQHSQQEVISWSGTAAPQAHRKARSLLLRWAVVLATVCFLFLVALSIWNIAVTKWQQSHTTVPGTFYSIDGSRMHLYCTGVGSPTIVIEAGLGYDWLDAQEVQPPLSRLTRVCTYDRSGLGWSEARSGPRDAITIARQLHTLLDVSGVQRPLVLMGHSGGGIFVRVFASEYPREVTGIVLVDSASPQQFNDLPGFQNSFQEFLRNAPEKAYWRRLRILLGIQRLAGKCRCSYPAGMLEFRAQYDAEMCRADYEGAGIGEYMNFAESVSQAAEHKTLDTNLLIISSDPGRQTQKMLSSDASRIAEWDREQDELRALSSKSFRVIARNSSHNVYHDRPDVVTDQVSLFVAGLRAQTSLPFGSTQTK